MAFKHPIDLRIQILNPQPKTWPHSLQSYLFSLFGQDGRCEQWQLPEEIPLFYVLILHPLQEEVVARLLVLLQDAITSNQLAVHILMISIHLIELCLSLSRCGKRFLVVQLWIPEHMGHLYGLPFYHRIWCFWKDQSSLMLLC
jgi:hypothetical protein